MRTSEFLDKVSNLKSIAIDIFGSKLFNPNINSIKIRMTHMIFCGFTWPKEDSDI